MVGALTADTNKSLLDVANWKKSPVPFFSAYTLKGIDGPGHNSFFTDEFGKTMIAFHGQDGGRQSGIHPIHFGKDGMPVLLNDDELV